MGIKQHFKKIVTTMKRNNENGARKAVLEDLFYDFNRSRSQVYVMNFVRGILFGAGSVIGGTLVIGLLVFVLGLLGTVIPPLGDFFEGVSKALSVD